MCILLAGEDLLLDELIDSPDLHGSVYKKKKIAFNFFEPCSSWINFVVWCAY